MSVAVAPAATQQAPGGLPRSVRAVGLLLVCAAMIAFPLVYSSPAVTSIGVFTVIFLIAVSGWNIFSGYSGYIALGHAAFYGIGQYTVALVASRWHVPGGWKLLALLPVGGLVAAAAAVPIGLLLLRVRKHTFVVLTIAIFFILQLLAFNLRGLTHGNQGAELPFPSWDPATFNNIFYYVGLGFAALAVLVSWWVRRSKYGLGLLAIRDDEERALGLGIRTTRTKLIAFVISAFFCGVAGGLYAAFVGSVYPQFAFDPNFDLTIAVMTFLGGLGTLAGPILGALILEPTQQYFLLQFGSANTYLIIYGALFVLILRLLPAGVVPGVARLWRARALARQGTADPPATPAGGLPARVDAPVPAERE